MFGVSHQTIANWQAEGMPVESRGGANLASEFDSAACIAWRVECEMRRGMVGTPRDRLFTLQAESLEIDLAAKREQLVPAALLGPRLRAVTMAARRLLEGEAERLSRCMEFLDSRAREDLMREAFDDYLRRLAGISPTPQ